jgi:hypothetical protein
LWSINNNFVDGFTDGRNQETSAYWIENQTLVLRNQSMRRKIIDCLSSSEIYVPSIHNMLKPIEDHDCFSSSINGRRQAYIFLLGLLGLGLTIDKNMNFDLINILGGKL